MGSAESPAAAGASAGLPPVPLRSAWAEGLDGCGRRQTCGRGWTEHTDRSVRFFRGVGGGRMCWLSGPLPPPPVSFGPRPGLGASGLGIFRLSCLKW